VPSRLKIVSTWSMASRILVVIYLSPFLSYGKGTIAHFIKL
jgi:hypothetical protein